MEVIPEVTDVQGNVSSGSSITVAVRQASAPQRLMLQEHICS